METEEVGLPSFDRREHFRGHYIADVEIERGSSLLRARTLNISLGGMLLEMENPLWVGAEFLARVSLEEEEPLEVGCVVRQVLPEAGMGVEFLDLKPAEQARLHRLVQMLPH
ncbi:PilZ domain-containing protein [Acidobacteriia bacterium AH_259_A11_L15]|nr:PilZ domain-containing protein [Acidobacteriia bacterium AH_259_A11_L15]